MSVQPESVPLHGLKQQSSVESNWEPTQLLMPHFKPFWQSESLSQSPSPAAMKVQPLFHPPQTS
jgi:hypothetical protein